MPDLVQPVDPLVHAAVQPHGGLAAAARAVADAAELAWLDDSTGRGASLLATQPLAVLEQHHDRPATLAAGGRVLDSDDSAWTLWSRTHARLRAAVGPAAGALWIGYLGYDAATLLERLPAPHRDDVGLPMVRLALFDACVRLIGDGSMQIDAAPALCDALLEQRCRETAADALRGAIGAMAAETGVPAARAVPVSLDWPPARQFTDAVRRARDYIAAGDIYQVNLSQRVVLHGVGDATAAYLQTRAHNAAGMGALLRWDGGAIASFSPELLLRIVAGRVLTSPIKGTRPRTGDVSRDRAAVEALLDSGKEAAELAMIVDLHRNDLGRVCRPGSVVVVAARRVEVHPTVFHTVADIGGDLRDDADPIAALAACFPAGSVTGVPKIRAMQIIRELEPVGRGAYTGAIGYLTFANEACWNVGIRTLQLGREKAVLHVGGGIVAESDPDAEYDETLAKGRGILSSLQAASTPAPSDARSPSRDPGR